MRARRTGGWPARATALVRRHVGELSRFLSVGVVAYVVDVGLFNLLSFGPGRVLDDRPLTAKVVAVAVATLVSWVGNRYWTFASRRTDTPVRELGGFVVVNLLGMSAAVGCLAFSHYVLGLTSPLADNVSANVVGLALGTALRYVAYRRLVFTGPSAAGLAGAVSASADAERAASPTA